MADVQNAVARLIPRLGAENLAGLTIAAEDELYEWADEALQRLARKLGLFVARAPALTLAGGSPTLAAPARHLSTIHVSWDIGGGDLRPLRPISTAELEAKDNRWPTRSGNPAYFTQDQQGTETLLIYKIPAASQTLAAVYHEHPAAITSGAPAFTGPAALEDYLGWRMLQAARAKESDEAMPEVGEHAARMADLYEGVFASYWGTAQ